MRRMFVDGEFVNSVSGETFAVENPATEEEIDQVPRAREADVQQAVSAAVRAQDDWRFVPGIEKCELLHRIAFNIREQDRKSTRLNSSHVSESRMPSSA